MFTNTTSVNLRQNSVFAKLPGCQKYGFRKDNCIFWVLSFLMLEKDKQKKEEKAKKHIKIVFLRWSSENDKNEKMSFFSARLLDTICVRKGE